MIAIITRKYLLSIIKYTQKSFSLVEISIALAVMGIISSGGVVAYQNSNPKLRSDIKKITKIQESMQNFFVKNNRLPSPALLNTTANTEEAVLSTNKYTSYDNEITNNILWGNVPVKALGLPNDFLYDSRGKVIEYVVHSSLVEGINVENKTYTKKGYISDANAYNIHYENSSGEKYYYNPTGISIVDEKSNTTVATNIAYALISKQGNDKCYNNKKSSNTTIPSDSTKYNCDKFYSNSAITLHQGYSKSFDNIVSYITLDELVVSMAKVKNQLTEMRQGRVLEYQNKYDENLTTEKKDITGALNELKAENIALQNAVNALTTRLNAIQSTDNTDDKLYLMGATSQDVQPTTNSNSKIYMQDGTLYLTKTTDLSGTADNKPAFIVGGSDAQGHIEIDPNEIQAKADGTTVSDLHLNYDGGDVRVGKSGGTSKIYLNGEELALTKKSICEMMYPVGSVYMNSKNNTNPATLLGCGTWGFINANYYLMSSNPNKNSSDYDAYNNSYGNYAGTYRTQCLPNIYGEFEEVNLATCEAPYGAFTVKENYEARAWYNKSSDGCDRRMSFNAARSNSTYRDNCWHVRPYSYVVYIWIRNS